MTLEYLLTEVCRWLLFYSLALGALAKISGFKGFSQNLSDGFGISASLQRPITMAIITVEASIAVALLFLTEYSAWLFGICLVLFALFSGILVWALRQERKITCHCFGQSDGAISILDVWRNVFLISACLPGLLFPHWSSAQTFISDNAIPQYLIIALALPCFLVVIYFKDTVNLLRTQSVF